MVDDRYTDDDSSCALQYLFDCMLKNIREECFARVPYKLMQVGIELAKASMASYCGEENALKKHSFHRTCFR